MLIEGKTPSGDPQAAAVDADGKLLVSGAGGGVASSVEVTALPGTTEDNIFNTAGALQAIQAMLGDGTGDSVVERISQIVTETQPLSAIEALLTSWITTNGPAEMQLVPDGNTGLIGVVTSRSDTVATATLTNVAASASSVTLLAANANRKRVVIHNDSTAILRIKFGATASATSFTHLLYGGGTYESPSSPVYTGIMDGLWDSATGAARVTEL